MRKALQSFNLRMMCYGFKKLWRISPLYFALNFLLNVFCGFITPLIAVIWQHIIDLLVLMLQESKWQGTIILFLFGYSAASLVAFLLMEIQRYLKQNYSNMIDSSFTSDILSKSAEFPMELFDDPSVYDQIHIALGTSSRACLTLLEIFSGVIKALVQLLSFAIIVAKLNWIFIPICIVSSLPQLLLNVKMEFYWYNIFAQRTEATRLVQYMEQILTKNENIKEIKLYKIYNKIISFIEKTLQGFLQADKEARKQCLRKAGLIGALNEFSSLAVKIIIIYLGVSSGKTIGLITLFITSQSNLNSSTSALFDQISNLSGCLLNIQALESIEKISVANKPESRGAVPFPHNYSCIEFKNVSFKYPNSNKEVLENLSFKFKNGMTYSIVGLNGSGKTTLIKLLLRLYTPSAGEILIDGIDINKIDLGEYYNQIGAVFQDYIKFPFSLYENISCGTEDPDNTFYNEAVEVVDLLPLIHSLPFGKNTPMMKEWKNGIDISQGQWQKVAIARACFGNRAICIFDEPFSSIDAKTEAQIVQKLNSYRNGKLSIYITHQFTSISLADQILVINDGHLVESGTHLELLKKDGLYSELHSTQFRKLKKVSTSRLS